MVLNGFRAETNYAKNPKLHSFPYDSNMMGRYKGFISSHLAHPNIYINSPGSNFLGADCKWQNQNIVSNYCKSDIFSVKFDFYDKNKSKTQPFKNNEWARAREKHKIQRFSDYESSLMAVIRHSKIYSHLAFQSLK